jgi:F-type H+-transporting ATPase subunit delta
MKSRTVAKRYARALLALAKENGDLVGLADALEQVAAALQMPSVGEIVRNPAIGVQGRHAVVRSLVDSLRLPGLLANCLHLLAERQRLDIVDDLWRAYVNLVDHALGRSRVVLRSAAPLTEEQVQQMLAVLRRLTGKEEIVPVLEVEPDLLGGVLAEADGVVYDGSVRTQVDELARQMVAEA